MEREKLARYLSKASMYRALSFMEQLFLAGFRAKKEEPVTRCIRCKRPLVDPESIKRGYGRVCWGRYNKDIYNLKEEQHKRQATTPWLYSQY